MNTISPQTGTFVKGKTTSFPASISDGNSENNISAADVNAKLSQAQDLQNADPGARDPFELEKDIGVPCARRDGKGPSLTAGYTTGIIVAYVGYGRWGPLAEDTISRVARCGRGRVIRAVKEAEAAGYLLVNDNGKCHRYYVQPLFKRVVKMWVKPSLVRDDGLSIVQAVWLSLVKFRQGKNQATWFTHRGAAEILGVSYATIYRTAAWCAAQCLVQKRHKPQRRSSKNEYALTCQGESATGVFGPESARSKQRALGQTIGEGGKSYARSARLGVLPAQFSLSFDCRLDQEPYELLRRFRVHPKVARPMAVEWRDDYDSVKQAIVNAIIRRDDDCRRMRRLGLPALRFNLAGYIVATLNGARSECHGVRLSKLARAGKAKRKGGARAAGRGLTAKAELERIEKYAETVLKPCLAKPPTPGKSAIPVKKPQFRDKSAEDRRLRAVLAAVRSRSYSCRKYANLGHKLHISTKLDKQAGISVQFPFWGSPPLHVISEGLIMRQERRCKYVGGPRMRPEDPADCSRIASGVLRSMQLAGYDYPIRKLRRSGDVSCVTLPLQVRGFLELERGDWLVFGETPWRGVAAFVRISDEQRENLRGDDRRDAGRLARKIQGGKGGFFVTIPRPICEILSAELGDFLVFGLTPRPGVISIAAIKGGGDSAGSRRSG